MPTTMNTDTDKELHISTTMNTDADNDNDKEILARNDADNDNLAYMIYMLKSYKTIYLLML
jgi:hypothetical protein